MVTADGGILFSSSREFALIFLPLKAPAVRTLQLISIRPVFFFFFQ